ncbi:MAG TPA: hypothetical protein VFF30_02330 [Nitrososphaerales archaeon]|nr:hypothetical protein [Nitrososphaerales archaeon]
MKSRTIQKLLEGIRRYGLENVSTLSKWIDIPVETARYMIWEELPKHKISVGISVNLPRIGLGRWMVSITPTDKSHADSIETFLRNGAGLMYLARIVPTNSLLGFVGIPFGEHYRLREQLEHLKSASIIENYSLEEVEWSRAVSFNPAFYDFKERTWKFDWKDVEQNKEPLLTPYTKEDQAPIVDYKDLLILRELQLKVPRTLSKLSKKLSLDQHNLRYHYKSHARRAIQGYYLKLLSKDSNAFQSTLIFVYEVPSEKALVEARTVALSLPFTTRVWKTEREYGWHVSCPGEYTNGVLSYVNEKFAKIPGRLRLLTVDSNTEHVGAIPVELFDEKSGTWKYEPSAPVELLKKKE